MKNILLFVFALSIFGCAKPAFDPEWTQEQAPETFSARFETTKGNFDLEITRRNSPKAVDRLYQLIRHGYFDNSVFYRVVPHYIAQFGNSDQAIMGQWRSVKVPDEPVILSNKKGTITFARFGNETRDLELFINLNDNTELDTVVVEGIKGYPALGTVSAGMDVVKKLYSGHGENTMAKADNLYLDRNAFLRSFPNLDLIKKAYLTDN
ncbi:peptidylprolyl isomerase [Flavobacterium selenitireducens]|uniref:peptidylprolyl isomerase n=1 Tax=Flavobacterium selenitireducens TaxID=2722704 RepID=UPI00168BD99D|nr:peptidylprolyl isomerase [Flavobacterium selenitireducens]MBD3581536.1 peptidylprolyl isomerase [Flavobacterium selenitireducens]